MNLRRIAVPGALLVGLVVIGRAAGMSASSGCAGSALVPPADVPENIVVAQRAVQEQLAAPAPRGLNNKVVPGEFVMKLRGDVPFVIENGRLLTEVVDLHRSMEVLGATGARAVHRKQPRYANPRRSLGLDRTVRFSSGRGLNEVIAELELHSAVEWVEPVSRVTIQGVPNDSYFVYQWNLATLGIPAAWDITQGEGVIVAVLDTGVSAFTDGFLNLLDGYDFVDDDSDAADQNGHGSHVAGTVAQSTNNVTGVAGVAPQASILPVRVLGTDGSGRNSDVAEGIIWAVDNGAQVINLSLGSSVGSQVLEDAVLYAWESDVVVVAATGNDSFTNFIGFPAAFGSVIAVGATDLNRVVAPYSNQGLEIDLVAPGGDITVDADGDGLADGIIQETEHDGEVRYWVFEGTSMAAPHVAGVAALLIADGAPSALAVRDALVSTAEDLGSPGFDHAYGHGMLNPAAALAHPPRPDPAALQILGVETQAVSATRATVQWFTSTEADTHVDTETGFALADDALVRVHRATIRGRASSTVQVTVRSGDGDVEVEEVVQITF